MKNSPKKEAWPLRGKVENAVTEPKNLTIVEHREVNPVDIIGYFFEDDHIVTQFQWPNHESFGEHLKQ